MSFLKTLLPLLQHGSTINFSLKEVGGKVQIIIEPQLAKFEPETTDEVVATLQSVLAHPIRITCERETTDEQFLAALTSISPGHAAASDQLAEYRQRLADAAAEATRKEAEKAANKTTKAIAKPAKGATPAAASLSAPAGESDGDVDDTAAASDAPATPTPVVSPSTTDFQLF
ncbi:PRTRC system protein E (plasmid) [Xanthomonas citri pv. citri]|uniref:PRTRC system protein E n=1 Tax=Xanthomonas citri TaxID=346 RepID=UPI00193178C8|nr:PRTRC system protein E [Xanthomonas citri]QRD62724.1 PRTRC system protein E [Xanthomonas citri pv. citri]QRD67051.1 PRTRC system protein E [Xanthomonas citri pv. citri]QRD71696.1 PRTRC system protein E [Xanthomonas citri pv. citri]